VTVFHLPPGLDHRRRASHSGEPLRPLSRRAANSAIRTFGKLSRSRTVPNRFSGRCPRFPVRACTGGWVNYQPYMARTLAERPGPGRVFVDAGARLRL
jgi:hypothetical protein